MLMDMSHSLTEQDKSILCTLADLVCINRFISPQKNGEPLRSVHLLHRAQQIKDIKQDEDESKEISKWPPQEEN